MPGMGNPGMMAGGMAGGMPPRTGTAENPVGGDLLELYLHKRLLEMLGLYLLLIHL